MKEKLQEYALLAEVISAIAIVISLIFVGFQIQEGNKEARSITTQASLDAEMLLITEILLYADVWDKVANGQSLEEGIETRRGINLYNMAMIVNENQYFQIKAGYLETESRLESNGLANFPIYEIWRNTPGAKSRSKEFLDALEKYRNQGPGE